MQKIVDQLKAEKELEVLNLNAGKGSYGSVIIVKDKNEKEFAIKILSLFDGIDSICQTKLERARNEAKILKRCRHPHIVKYEGEFQIGFNYFIVMEKCEMSLQLWVENQRAKKIIINKTLFNSFAIQILKGIEYLYSINFLLRDISLNNILIDKENRVKLCDFGLAKQFDPYLESQAFLTSQVKGAYFYLAPEILEISMSQKNESVFQNIQGDIWAAGICLYILAGASYFHVMQFTQGIEPYQFQNSLGNDINLILMKMLSRKPQSRPPVSELIQSFEQIKNPSRVSLIQKNSDEFEDQLFNQAKSQYQLGDIDSCLDKLYSLIEIDSENKKYLEWIVKLSQEKKNIDDAIYWQNQCLKLDERDDESWCKLGSIYFEQSRNEEAKKHFKKALELNPYCQSATRCLEQLCKLDKSSKKLEEDKNSGDVNVLLSLAKQQLENQMIDEAIISYKKIININPQEIPALLGLADIYQSHKKMYDVAMSYYKKALEIYPTYKPPN